MEQQREKDTTFLPLPSLKAMGRKIVDTLHREFRRKFGDILRGDIFVKIADPEKRQAIREKIAFIEHALSGTLSSGYAAKWGRVGPLFLELGNIVRDPTFSRLVKEIANIYYDYRPKSGYGGYAGAGDKKSEFTKKMKTDGRFDSDYPVLENPERALQEVKAMLQYRTWA